ncbi:MAG: apolipoprotein N-acyltransferase [Chitinophagaceae bacterium]
MSYQPTRKRFSYLIIAIVTGLLLFAAWPVSPLTFLIFVAWVPLLWLETKVQSRKQFFGLVYIIMFVWNVSTTWWIWNASPPGAAAAFLANSLLMCLPWLGYKIAKKRLGQPTAYLSLIAFWMCFEYIHLQDWGLSWPWLTLGNVFATHPEWIQWYEYTGTSGGTLWVLLSNILVFSIFREYQQNNRSRKYFITMLGWLFLLVIPSVLFNLKNRNTVSTGDAQNIVIVQPNIDPYEKVADVAGSFEAQLAKLIATTEKQVDSNTVLVVWPETALYIASRIDEEDMRQNYFLTPLWAFLQQHPGISLFTGIESFRFFKSKTKYSEEFNGLHYESYNGSVLLDSSGALGFYHKSMLVPGVETLPWFLKFVDKWFEKFGGTTAGYAKQKERIVLEAKGGFRIAPSICYESIYGEFMSRYIRNGANLICIITNDGWWKNTAGHKQHMNYARLRAVETRTWVARSANTGISCFIDPSGRVIEPQPYNTNAAIKWDITADNTRKTFFVRHGDLLSRMMIVLAILLFVLTIILKIMKRSLNERRQF